MHYEMLKHTGEYPLIGVNTFLSSKGSPTLIPGEVIRAEVDEKERQIATVEQLAAVGGESAQSALDAIRRAALQNQPMFDALMEAAKICSLGSMTEAMFEVGGQYRRNM